MLRHHAGANMRAISSAVSRNFCSNGLSLTNLRGPNGSQDGKVELGKQQAWYFIREFAQQNRLGEEGQEGKCRNKKRG
jgi:hypothetical protein